MRALVAGRAATRPHVLLNAGNVTAAGPRAVIASLLPPLLAGMADWQVTLLCPDEPAYRDLPLDARVTRLYLARHRGAAHDVARLAQVHLAVPALVRRLGIDCCLTLGDVGPIRPRCAHVIFLHLAHLVYDDEEIGPASLAARLKRRYLRAHFGRSARRAAAVVVQTSVMGERLHRRYGVAADRIHVIPQPVPAHLGQGTALPVPPALARCRKPVKLLMLAAYYPHKNHAILPAVAAELRARTLGAEVQIFVTLDDRDPASAALRQRLEADADVITNLGALGGRDVAGALRGASALFLPTLIESYGLTYLEAMACGRPILTSDRDFARWVCGDLAAYFEPSRASAIADAIQRFAAAGVGPEWSARAAARLAELPGDWTEVAGAFLRLLDQAIVADASAASRPTSGAAGVYGARLT